MDFGQVLDRWDRMTGSGGGGKNTSPVDRTARGLDNVLEEGSQAGANAHRIDPLTAWLRTHDIVDKDDAGGRQTLVEDRPLAEQRAARRRRLLKKPPDETLDLHGKTQDAAWSALQIFFDDARRRGAEKLLVIHGKGNHSVDEAVLNKLVRRFIEQCPYAGESGRSEGSQGGSGATWVLLK